MTVTEPAWTAARRTEAAGEPSASAAGDDADAGLERLPNGPTFELLGWPAIGHVAPLPTAAAAAADDDADATDAEPEDDVDEDEDDDDDDDDDEAEEDAVDASRT